MNRPWMPLYIADYLRDTSHLRALESGAYLHLIMAYWISGKLPNDDKQLATIAKLTDREWRAAKLTLAAFFGPEWSSHKRIDAELAKTNSISTKRKAAVEQREIKRRSSDASNDRTLHTTHITRQKEDDEDTARPPLISAEANELADKVATIVGHDLSFVPPAWHGAAWRTQTWLNEGWKPGIILDSVREQMGRRHGDKPDRIQYFEKGIAAAHARAARPLPTVKIIEGETVNVHEKSGNVIAAADRLVARLADFDRPPPDSGGASLRSGEGANVVRLLPER